jgi:D-alanyl-lipoteichoic acid acyltransferase DltB (MBOAT superfamily)
VLFPTATFAVFFLVVLPLSWLAMSDLRRWRVFIVAASYVFYGWWDWHFVFLLALCTLWNHVLAIRIVRAQRQGARKALLAVAVAGDLSLLGYFKYYDFFVSSAHNLAVEVGMGLPLSTLGRFAAYLSFFPHLVAGPIVRPGELIPQMEVRRDPRRVDSSRAFYLIATGLFKKVVIANYLATHITDRVFAVPGSHSSAELLVAVYAYAVQIYADFSGYTDIAIGLALLLGFTFPQNFDSPYAAVSLRDFWRRWHMTLSRWLRDYLYIPLGGNRKGRVRTYANLMITMLLGGLWHGASWTFVVWGGIHGTGLALEHARRDRPGYVEPTPGRAGIWLRRLLTFNVVCFAWIFFRSDSIASAWQMITGLFTRWGAPSPLVTAGVLFWIVVGIASQYLPARFPRLVIVRFSRLPLVGQAAVLGAALMLVNAMGPQGVSPFIYFRF